MLCCSTKLYTSFLNSRIVTIFNVNEELVDEQNVFYKDRSWQGHIFVLDSIVRNILHKNEPVYTAFIDLQKACDCVERDVVFYKLLNAVIDGKLYFATKIYML